MIQLLPYLVTALLAISMLAVTSRARGDRYVVGMLHAVAVLILIVFQGTRYRVGTDDDTYRGSYDLLSGMRFQDAILDSTAEPGYQLLAFGLSSFGAPFEALALIVSAISIAAFFLGTMVLKRALVMPAVYFVLFGFYTSGFNIIRQFAAVCIVYLGWCLLRRGKTSLALMSFVIAISFHYTAIIVLVAVILVMLRGLVAFTSLTIFSIVAYGARTFWLSRLLEEGGAGERYVGYAEISGFSPGRALMLVLFLVAVTLCFLIVRVTNTEHLWRPELVLATAGILLILSSFWFVFAERLALYFLLPLAVVFAEGTQTGVARRTRVSIYVRTARCAVLFLGAAYFTFSVGRYSGLLPYESWLFSQI